MKIIIKKEKQLIKTIKIDPKNRQEYIIMIFIKRKKEST